jgi:hypothetical protein
MQLSLVAVSAGEDGLAAAAQHGLLHVEGPPARPRVWEDGREQVLPSIKHGQHR